jgi:hypothetical protein
MISSGSKRSVIREPAPAVGVRFAGSRMYVELADGREVGVPLAWFPRLAKAAAGPREHWEMIGGGFFLHWPDLDEDIAVAHLLGISD